MLRKVLKVLGILAAVVIVLVAAAAILLNTEAVQNRLMQSFVSSLKEQLQTDVRVGHVSIRLLSGTVVFRDVELDDRQGRRMLGVGRLALGLDMKAQRRREVVVTKAEVSGICATLCQPASPTDSATNFQFLLDAFKKSKASESQPPAEKASSPMAFHIATLDIGLDSLHFTTDNGQPRRNIARPHRGAFEVGHLDLLASMKVRLEHITAEGARLRLTECSILDRGSGLQLDSLCLHGDICKDSLSLHNVDISLPHSHISLPNVLLLLPDKAKDRTISYHAPHLSVTTQLRDISQPFAPVLKDFTTQLQVQCSLDGDADGMQFSDVQVSTTDQRLSIQAQGNITHLRDKLQRQVHFDVSSMTAQSGIPERIINHFPVKKHMMKQLHALGRIDYKGYFDVFYKRQTFVGRLGTQAGAVNMNFTVDGLNKYVFGNVRTTALQLGKVFDMSDIGPIACRANFRFDISKPRTARMRRHKGGKLPIGNVNADITEASYKFATVRNIEATIVSDGAEAQGTISNKGRRIDLSCDFSFTNTDNMRKLKVKPHLNFHRKRKKNS